MLVDADGVPRLLDFGISRLLEGDEGEATLTVAGHRYALTPEYAAPEQFGGEAGVAADVYSLGAILYQLVSGVLPYPLDRRDLAQAERIVRITPPQPLAQAIARADAADAIEARLEARSTSLRAYRASVRGDLSRILDKALAKEPQRRYASVEAFADDLSRWLAGAPVRVSGNAFGYRLGKFVRRNRWGVATAALALAIILAASVALAWQAEQAQREATNAIQLKDYLIEILRQYDGQNATSKASALRSLDAAAQRMQSLTPGSEVRLELLCVLLDMYAERNFDEEGMAFAAKELPLDPQWQDDPSDPVRLRAYVLTAWLRKESGQTAQARADLQRVMETYPRAHDAAYAEAMKVVGESWADENNYAQAVQWQQAALHLFESTTTLDDARLLYSRTLTGTYLTVLRQGREGRALVERALADLPAGDSKVRVYLCAMGAMHSELFGDFETARKRLLENRDVVKRLGYTRMPEFYASLRVDNDFSTGRLAEAKAAVDAVIHGGQGGSADRLDLAAKYVLRGEVSDAQGDAAAAAADFAAAAKMLAPDRLDTDIGVYARAMQAVSLAVTDRPEAARTVLPSVDGNRGSYATVAARAARGRVMESEGRRADAIARYQRALDELDSVRTQPADIRSQIRENRVEIRILGWRARAECEQGDAAGAARDFDEAMQRAHRILGEQHPYTQELASNARASCAAPTKGGGVAFQAMSPRQGSASRKR